MLERLRAKGFSRAHAMVFMMLLTLAMSLVAIPGCNRTDSKQVTPKNQSQSSTHSSSQSSGQDSDDEQGATHRFVVLSPAIGVMLQDLGFEDSIVGRHTYDTALSKSIPVVGSHLDIDYELLIELNPKTLDDIANTIDDLYLKFVGFHDEPRSDDSLFDLRLDPTKKFDVELPSARLANAWSPIGPSATKAGRVLVLAGIEPPGAMGPGSFHAQLIERLGLTPAIVDGGMWQELDYEDVIELAPDSILVFAPEPASIDPNALIGEPMPMDWEQIMARLGGLGALPIPAIEHHRVAIITDPLGLLPSSSLARVADEVREAVEGWDE
ncbi:MAG: ABC transporter substrate-binding protein [Phycisphaerales bacterium]